MSDPLPVVPRSSTPAISCANLNTCQNNFHAANAKQRRMANDTELLKFNRKDSFLEVHKLQLTNILTHTHTRFDSISRWPGSPLILYLAGNFFTVGWFSPDVLMLTNVEALNTITVLQPLFSITHHFWILWSLIGCWNSHALAAHCVATGLLAAATETRVRDANLPPQEFMQMSFLLQPSNLLKFGTGSAMYQIQTIMKLISNIKYSTPVI